METHEDEEEKRFEVPGWLEPKFSMIYDIEKFKTLKALNPQIGRRIKGYVSPS